MPDAVIMPKTEMAMEEGTIVRWLKQEGEVVQAGEPLVEIESDKATMEAEAETSGTLLKIVHKEGDTVPVAETIAYIGESGESIPGEAGEATAEPGADVSGSEISGTKQDAGVNEASATRSAQAERFQDASGVRATPYARTVASRHQVELSAITPTGPAGEVTGQDVLAELDKNREKPYASPLARRTAELHQLDLGALTGTGPGGRITRDDVLLATETQERQQASVRSAAVDTVKSGGAAAESKREPLSAMRKSIARAMTATHQSVPSVTLDCKADVTRLVELREQLNSEGEFRYSLNDFVLKAVARALVDYPRINVRLQDEELVWLNEINLGMAVAMEEGLVVPVIRQADTLTLRGLAEGARVLAERAKDRKLTSDEMEGAGFTVTNLGMYGIRSFTPIINLPQAAILGVNTVESELRLRDGQVVEGKVMGLSLTVDHRVVDGAQGAIFLNHLQHYLERPLVLLAER